MGIGEIKFLNLTSDCTVFLRGDIGHISNISYIAILCIWEQLHV